MTPSDQGIRSDASQVSIVRSVHIPNTPQFQAAALRKVYYAIHFPDPECLGTGRILPINEKVR